MPSPFIAPTICPALDAPASTNPHRRRLGFTVPSSLLSLGIDARTKAPLVSVARDRGRWLFHNASNIDLFFDDIPLLSISESLGVLDITRGIAPLTKAHARPVEVAAIAAKTLKKDAFDPIHAEIWACHNTLLASPHAGGCSLGTSPEATAPGTAGVHALPDTPLAGDLVRNTLPGRPAVATPVIDGHLDDGRIHLRRHGLLVLRTHTLKQSSEWGMPNRDRPTGAPPPASLPPGPTGLPTAPSATSLLLNSIGPTPTLEDETTPSATWSQRPRPQTPQTPLQEPHLDPPGSRKP